MPGHAEILVCCRRAQNIFIPSHTCCTKNKDSLHNHTVVKLAAVHLDQGSATFNTLKSHWDPVSMDTESRRDYRLPKNLRKVIK